MCSAASEWTYYQPPKSQGFGHTATPRNPLAAWGLLESFIRDHAIANEWSTNGITIDSRPEFWTPSALDAVLATFTALLGPPDVVPPGTYKARPSALYTWFQKPAAGKPILLPTVMAAIEIASHLRKTRIDGHGAFHLHFGFDFFWRGHSESQTPPVRKPFVIGEPLDWGPRNPYSNLGIIVEDNLFIQPTFLFPYAWGSSALSDLLAEIAVKLPIKLRPHNFRRAIVNKRGDAFRLLRIATPSS
jgi:hypothetical protein